MSSQNSPKPLCLTRRGRPKRKYMRCPRVSFIQGLHSIAGAGTIRQAPRSALAQTKKNPPSKRRRVTRHSGKVREFSLWRQAAAPPCPLHRCDFIGRVEDGRGCDVARSVSYPRSSIRTCGFLASGSPTVFTAGSTRPHADGVPRDSTPSSPKTVPLKNCRVPRPLSACAAWRGDFARGC